jgi:hypothetical protein
LGRLDSHLNKVTTMKKHLVLATVISAAAGLWACSSDSSKDEASKGGAYPTTTSSNEPASAPTATASADTAAAAPTTAPATPTDNSSATPSSSGTDVAAMEATPPATDQAASNQQSQDYEKSQRK